MMKLRKFMISAKKVFEEAIFSRDIYDKRIDNPANKTLKLEKIEG